MPDKNQYPLNRSGGEDEDVKESRDEDPAGSGGEALEVYAAPPFLSRRRKVRPRARMESVYAAPPVLRQRQDRPGTLCVYAAPRPFPRSVKPLGTGTPTEKNDPGAGDGEAGRPVGRKKSWDRRCAKCGRRLFPDEECCPVCGTKVDEQ